jgi:hypothetical protein
VAGGHALERDRRQHPDRRVVAARELTRGGEGQVALGRTIMTDADRRPP